MLGVIDIFFTMCVCVLVSLFVCLSLHMCVCVSVCECVVYNGLMGVLCAVCITKSKVTFK